MDQNKACCCEGHRTKMRSEEEHKKLMNRLKRIEGQVRGVEKMLDENAYCPEIMVQISAINSALNSFNKELLASHMKSCVVEDIQAGKGDEAIDELAKSCRIAVVKVGKDGSMVKSGDEFHFIEPWPATPVDATGAGDTYAAGFLYAHSMDMPLKVCGEVGSIIAAKVVEVIGTKIDIPRWRDAKLEIRDLIAANSR